MVLLLLNPFFCSKARRQKGGESRGRLVNARDRDRQLSSQSGTFKSSPDDSFAGPVTSLAIQRDYELWLPFLHEKNFFSNEIAL